MTFKEQIELYLSTLPSEWKEKLTELLCEINSSYQKVDCQKVKDCETLTSLSNFSINNTVCSIQYKDEKGVVVTRSFDVSLLLNNMLEKLDPKCLTNLTTWKNLTFSEKIQLIIDSQCNCCDEGTSLRIFDIVFNTTAPFTGEIVLRIDGMNILSPVSFSNGDSIASIVNNLNLKYTNFATFQVIGIGIRTTMLTDNYQGITLEYYP